MRECLIVGRPNVGKTLLSLRLVEQVGERTPFLVHELPAGDRVQRRWSLPDAHRLLVASSAHTTLGVQTWSLAVATRGMRALILHDSTGLSDDGGVDAMVRKGMARTLERMVACDAIIHVVEAPLAASQTELEGVDALIRSFATARAIPRLQVLNKADLLPRTRQMSFGKAAAPKVGGALVSALHGTGMTVIHEFLRQVDVVH